MSAIPSDDWPNTSRLLPWLLAGFLAMVFLVPFDSIEAPFSIGVDAKLDRIFIVVIMACWLASFAGGGEAGTRFTPSRVHAGVALFLVVALISVVANADLLANLGELELAVKKLVLLFSYVALFAVTATTIRTSELRAFSKYVVLLACLTSVGVIYEFRTGTNVFYSWSAEVLPGFNVLPEPPQPEVGAASIVGPTQHGLALTALLATALPFAIVNTFQEQGRNRRMMWIIAACLILIATAATGKKAALVVPIAVIAVLALYRPREILRLAPLWLTAIIAMAVVTPGAIGTIKSRLFGATQSDASTLGRTRDYPAITPDVMTRPLIGRGYGSYDPDRYRILDNDYLGMLIETGVLGILTFLAMLGTVLHAAHGRIRSRDPVRGPPALAAAAGAVGFAVITTLFDSLSFAQAPYVFFFVAGIVAVTAPVIQRRTVDSSPRVGIAT